MTDPTTDARADKRHALGGIVQNALALATHFERVLAQEKDALIAQDMAAVDASISAKQTTTGSTLR